MRLKYSLVAIFTLATLGLKAQSTETTSAAVAYNGAQKEMMYGNMDKYAGLLEEAKSEIDKAVSKITADTKEKISSKAWYYKAMIYMDYPMALQAKGDTAAVKALMTEEYGNETKTAFENAMKSKNYADDLKTYVQQKAGMLFNYAGAEYKKDSDEGYTNAQSMYFTAGEMMRMVNVIDTNAYYNAAVCAEKVERFDLSLESWKVLAENNYRDGLAYYYMAFSYKQMKDDANYAKAIEDGLAKHPTKKELIIESVNYNLAKGNKKEALDALEKAIKADPNNKTVYYAAGSTFQDLMDQEGEKIDDETRAQFLEKAGGYYDKALEIDPNYLDAAYNKGAMYLNAGVDITKKANNLQLGDPQFEVLQAEAKKMYEKAIPALEKALELDGKNKGIVRNLKILYGKVGNKEKQLEMRDRKSVV